MVECRLKSFQIKIKHGKKVNKPFDAVLVSGPYSRDLKKKKLK